jgi:hypothetical protein
MTQADANCFSRLLNVPLPRWEVGAGPTCLVLAVVALAGIAAPCFGTQNGILDRAEDNPLVAPGPDTETVIRLLEDVIARGVEAERPVENMKVKGRCSDVVWTEPQLAKKPAQVPSPEWVEFLIVHKDGKRRAEWRPDAPSARVFHLMDGKALYSLQPGHFMINGISDLEKKWSGVTGFATWPTSVYYSTRRGFAPVRIALRAYINYLKGTEDDFFQRYQCSLRCYTDLQGLLQIKVNSGPSAAALPTTLAYSIDPRVGCQIVHHELERGVPGQPIHSIMENVVHLEAAPGVFYASKGESLVAGERDKSGHWRKYEFEVTSFDFGDFEYDASQFELSSLPVPKGCHVTDFRQSPAVDFVFGEPPLDENVLELAARGAPTASPPTVNWRAITIVFANGVLIAGIVALLLARRRRAKEFEGEK